MFFSNKIWAVIPARSGSKGLKNKNIKKIMNKPLIAHSIISAVKNKKISKVIFSSNSRKYISIAKKYNCDYYHKRSRKNSLDNSKDIDLFREIISFLKKKKIVIPKYFVHFRPTTPIRTNNTINKAIDIFLKKKKIISALKTVTLNSHNSLKDYIIKNKKLYSFYKKYGNNIDRVNIPRDRLPRTYIGNGVVDIYKTKNILKGKLLGNKVFPLITKELFCDIDNLNDFKYAKYLMSRSKKWNLT